MRDVVRRGGAVVATAVALCLLAACKAPGAPGTPTAGPSPSPTSTASPTTAPTDEPTDEPSDTPTVDPTDPGQPGGAEGVEISVTIESGFSMPNLVETSLKQARQSLDREGARSVVVVDARRGTTVAGASNGWAVCSHEPGAGSFVLESAEVVLAAAPNSRHCP